MKLNTAIIKDFDALDADGLRAAIAALDLPDGKAEFKMLKEAYQKKSNALDKVSSELAEAKKQLRAGMSPSEAEKAAQDEEARYNSLREEVDALKKENQIIKLKTKYISMGYDETSAEKAANSQCSGDNDALFTVIGEQNKRIEARLKADLLRRTPRPNGAGINPDKENTPENITLAGKIGEAKANSVKAVNDALKYYL